MYHEIRIGFAHAFGTAFCRLCVLTAIAVICQIDQLVLPFARQVVAHVSDQLVHRRTGFFHRLDRQTTDTDIHLGGQVIESFVIIEPTEIVIGGIGFYFIERVLRLVGQQQLRARVRQQVSVIERAVTHEQQPARFLSVAVVRAVVEHLHQPAIRGGIRCSGRELVIDLLVRHDRPRDRLLRLVCLR